jgi:hypothetical protein
VCQQARDARRLNKPPAIVAVLEQRCREAGGVP